MKEAWKQVFAIGAVWLVLVGSFAVLAHNRVNLTYDTAFPWILKEDLSWQMKWNPVFLVHQWDGYGYEAIAAHGYSRASDEKTLPNVVFFPLYPILMYLVSLIGFSLPMSGVLVSIIALGIGLYYLYRLVARQFPELKPTEPIFFLLIFPTSFFFFSMYTEALFFMTTVASWYYGTKENYLLAGVFGALAAITRIQGILLFPVLLVMAAEKGGVKSLWRNETAWLALIPAALVGFFTYFYFAFGDFFLYFHAEALWGRSLTSFHFIPSLTTHPAISNFILDLFFLVLGAVFSVAVWRRLGKVYGLYTVLSYVMIIASGSLNGIGRYLLTIFPICICLSTIKNEYVRMLWIVVSVLLLGLYAFLFTSSYWAG